jgi:hypothetical protein
MITGAIITQDIIAGDMVAITTIPTHLSRAIPVIREVEIADNTVLRGLEMLEQDRCIMDKAALAGGMLIFLVLLEG